MNYMLIINCNNLKSIPRNSFIRNRLALIVLTIALSSLIEGGNIFAQNTTIVFNTKANSTLNISKEIDNTYSRTITEELIADSTGSFTYNWDVDEFQFISCSFYDGARLFFPIKRGSHLAITYKGDFQFGFEGKDSEEISYYTNGYKDITRSFAGSPFNIPSDYTYDDCLHLIEKYHTDLLIDLDSLETTNRISPQFKEILKHEFNMLTTCIWVGTFRTKYIENNETNRKDSINVENTISKILNKISPLIDSGEILKYSLGRSSLAIYYTNQYRYLQDKTKQELLSKNKWADYLMPNKLGYLITPKKMQYKVLALELLDNYADAVTIGNTATYDYISETYPQNAFMPYLQEGKNAQLDAIKADHREVKYIEETINILAELSQIEEFAQKTLYIDLWATWCGPCIAEFKYINKVHELLSDYENIIPVYISVDEEISNTTWKAKTKIFNLNGYHLRANEKLITDIREKLFEGKGIGIPRYILLGKDGNILSDNLPRPSNIDKLRQELDKHFD